MSRLIALCAIYIALGLVMYMLFRIAILVTYVDAAAIMATSDIGQYVLLAMRLDALGLAIAAAPLIIVAMVCFFLPQIVYVAYLRLFAWALLCILILLYLIEYINYFFYEQYDSYINYNFFEFFSAGNTQAVLGVIWHEYPVISAAVLGLTLLGMLWWLYWFLVRWALNRTSSQTLYHHPHKIRALCLLCGLFLGVFYLARGNFTEVFPLRLGDTAGVAAHNAIIHNSTINGAHGLFDAWDDFAYTVDYSGLSDQAVLAAYNNLYTQQIDSLDHIVPDDLLITPAGATQRQLPNIIFTFMESFDSKGYHFVTNSYTKTNLLGAFKQHIAADLFYRNILSATRGTISTLERVFFNAPHYLFSRSQYMRNPHNPLFMPYQLRQAGYEVIFITPGTRYWHSIEQQIAPHVDKFYSYEDIQRRYPEAQDTVFNGLGDSFMYRFIQEHILQAKQDKPLFIIALTWSNHQPYVGCVPDGITPPPIDKAAMTAAIANDPSSTPDKSLARTLLALQCYAYAADAFGNFVTYIKNQPEYAANTIISATGDHYQRETFQAPAVDPLAVRDYFVPWYLYLPPKWRNTITYDPTRVGSHLDILPTLLHLCCPQVRYFPSGHNIFGRPTAQPIVHANEKLFFTDKIIFTNSQHYTKWRDSKAIFLGTEAAMYPFAKAEVAPFADAITRFRQQKLLLRWGMHNAYQQSN